MKKIWITILLATLALSGITLVASAGFAAEKPAPVHLTIKASEMKYAPAVLHLKAGVLVHLTLINDGKVLHDFNLQGIQSEMNSHALGHAGHNHGTTKGDSHIAVQPGESAGFHFTPRAGEFIFFCSVPGHRETGMVGRLLVH